MPTKDNLSRIPGDDEPLEVISLSKAYELLLCRAWIGREPALEIKLRHTAPDGDTKYRGGFLLFADRLPQVIEAIERAATTLQKEMMWNDRGDTRRRGE